MAVIHDADAGREDSNRHDRQGTAQAIHRNGLDLELGHSRKAEEDYEERTAGVAAWEN